MDNIPTRLNNPGDIKNTKTGAFNTYSSPEEGYNALTNDLNIKIGGKSKTGITPNSSLLDFSHTWAPSSDKNDPVSYAQNLASQLGVDVNTPIGSLKDRVSDFAHAIAKNEGYHGPQVAGTEQSASPATPITDNTQTAQPLYTDEEIQKNIDSLESQGASHDEVQEWLNSISQPSTPVANPAADIANGTLPSQPTLTGEDNPVGSLPGIKQATQFGVGVGSELGKAGLGLGELALQLSRPVASLMGLSDENKQAREQLDKLSKGIFDEPVKKETDTGFGTAGKVVGFVAPLAEDAVNLGKWAYGKVASKFGSKTAEEILATKAEDVSKLSARDQKLWYKTQADMAKEHADNLSSKAKDISDATVAQTNKEIQDFKQTIGQTSRDTAISLKQPAQQLMKDASAQYVELSGEAADGSPALSKTTTPEDLVSKIDDKFKDVTTPNGQIVQDNSAFRDSFKKDLGLDEETTKLKKGELPTIQSEPVKSDISNQSILDKAREIMQTVSKTARGGAKVYSPSEYEAMEKYRFLMEHLGENGVDMGPANKFWREWAPLRDRIVREVKPFDETNVGKMPITSTLQTARGTATTAKQVASKLDAENFISEIESRMGVPKGSIGKEVTQQMEGLEKAKLSKTNIQKVTQETMKQIKLDKKEALKTMSLEKFDAESQALKRERIKKALLYSLGVIGIGALGKEATSLILK